MAKLKHLTLYCRTASHITTTNTWETTLGLSSARISLSSLSVGLMFPLPTSETVGQGSEREELFFYRRSFELWTKMDEGNLCDR